MANCMHNTKKLRILNLLNFFVQLINAIRARIAYMNYTKKLSYISLTFLCSVDQCNATTPQNALVSQGTILQIVCQKQSISLYIVTLDKSIFRHALKKCVIPLIMLMANTSLDLLYRKTCPFVLPTEQNYGYGSAWQNLMGAMRVYLCGK